MKILLLDNIVPYPVDHGGVMRTWNFIKALSPEHELSLLCLNTNNFRGSLRLLRQHFKKVWVVAPEKKSLPHGRLSQKIRKLNYLRKRIPWEIYDTYSLKYEKKLLEVLSRNRYDVVFARFLMNGKYLIKNQNQVGGKMVIDLDNLDSIVSQRKILVSKKEGLYKNFRRLLNNYFLECYYSRLDSISGSIVCSTKDKAFLYQRGLRRNVFVIPNSIEILKYHGVRDIMKNEWETRQKIILFCGALHYEPNIDALRWFIKEIFSLIREKEPRFKFHIVGINPLPEIKNLADGKNVFVFPNVPSVLPYYQECSMVVVPIRIAGGTRIKIFEALACRRPIITTQIGAEGLDLINGKHCLIKDTPEEFARSCLNLLEDYSQVRRMVKEGYKFVEDYDSEKVGGLIKKIFEDKIA